MVVQERGKMPLRDYVMPYRVTIMVVGQCHELSNSLVGKPSVLKALEIALRLLTRSELHHHVQFSLRPD